MLAAGFPDNFASSYHTMIEFFRTGGWFIAPIVICWFISVTLLIWKALDLRRRKILPPELTAELDQIGTILREGRFPAFQTYLQNDPSVLAALCKTGISPHHLTPETATRATETQAREEVSKLERGIPILEIIFTIAPMLGLIGTVSGLVRIFSSLGTGSSQSAEQAKQIALGIAEAMNTTIAGLVVAVPALVGHVMYSRHLERIALRLSTIVTHFLDTCWSHAQEPPQPQTQPPPLPGKPV